MDEEIYYKQSSIFSLLYEAKKITKPIRLIELFAGIGSQYKALSLIGKYLKRDNFVESYKICEWAYNSILAYNYINIRDFTDYSEGKTKEEMIHRIKGISTNYNEPLTEQQLNKKPIGKICLTALILILVAVIGLITFLILL